MDTTDQVNTALSESETQVAPAPTGCGSGVSGGMDINGFISKNGKMLFWVSVVLAGVMVLLLMLFIFGRLHFGKKTTSTYTSSFAAPPKAMVGQYPKSNFGNYPNWYMQDGCAGYNCPVDTSSGRSLGFGVSDFESKKSNFGPLPGVRQNMAVSSDAQRRAAEDLLKKSSMEAAKRQAIVDEQQRQEHLRAPHQMPISHMTPNPTPRREGMTAEEAKKQEDAARAYIASRTVDEVGARQARVLSGCNNAWDPMATEEAKVLGAVGVYKTNTPGMSGFTRAVNDNVPLTDAQLEAIMQGGEPYTISPASLSDQDYLASQQRQEQIMAPPKGFH